VRQTRESFALQFEQLHVNRATWFRSLQRLPTQRPSSTLLEVAPCISGDQCGAVQISSAERLDLADSIEYAQMFDQVQALVENRNGSAIDRGASEAGCPIQEKTSPESERAFGTNSGETERAQSKLNKQAERNEQFVRKDLSMTIESELQDNLKDLSSDSNSTHTMSASGRLPPASSPADGKRRVTPELAQSLRSPDEQGGASFRVGAPRSRRSRKRCRTGR